MKVRGNQDAASLKGMTGRAQRLSQFVRRPMVLILLIWGLLFLLLGVTFVYAQVAV